jgi:hypothetical protein
MRGPLYVSPPTPRLHLFCPSVQAPQVRFPTHQTSSNSRCVTAMQRCSTASCSGDLPAAASAICRACASCLRSTSCVNNRFTSSRSPVLLCQEADLHCGSCCDQSLHSFSVTSGNSCVSWCAAIARSCNSVGSLAHQLTNWVSTAQRRVVGKASALFVEGSTAALAHIGSITPQMAQVVRLRFLTAAAFVLIVVWI